MTVLLAIETRQSNGAMCRVTIGCDLRPLVSWFIVFRRLF